MALVHFIAHRISRGSPSGQAQVGSREQVWALNGYLEECFRELKQAVLKRSGKEYGRFSDDRANFPVASWVEEFGAEKISFLTFSANAMEQLKIELEKTELVFDGFIFFAHEKLEEDELLHFFVVQHNTGYFIDGNLDVSESLFLDTAGVQLAAKLNIGHWKSDDLGKAEKSLAILRWRGEKELTEVFERFLGFTEKIDVHADTQEFLSIVSEYTRSLPKEYADHTKSQVVDYCLEQDKAGKSVVINELSGKLKDQSLAHQKKLDSGEPPPLEFSQYLADKQPRAKKELIADKTQLRNYVRISGRNDTMSMSFEASCLGDVIVYDAQSDHLVINTIPSSLKAKLVKHLQNS